MWVVMQHARWENFEVMGLALNSKDVKVNGSTGVLLVFDDYDNALNWADGKDELIFKIKEGRRKL